MPREFKLQYTYDKPFYVGRWRILYDQSLYRHFHSGGELNAVAKGSPTLLLGDREFPLKKGDVYVLDPMTMHETIGKDGELIVCHMTRESIINIDPDLLDCRLLAPFISVREGADPRISDRPDLFNSMVEAEKAYAANDPFHKLKAWLPIQRVLIEAAEAHSSKRAFSEQTTWRKNNLIAEKAMAHIRSTFARSKSLKQIGKSIGISASSLSHIFKEQTGLTPIDFRNQVRISEAARRIVETDDKITAIALECGFRSPTQFHRLFKRLLHKTPASLRASA